MLHRLLCSTRKGLISFEKLDGQWQTVQKSFIGNPVTAVVRNHHDGTMVAALNLGHFGVKLHRSKDDGESWQEISAPSYAGIEEDKDAPSLALVWTLEYDEENTLWAGTIPGGLFKSLDHGENWSLIESLWNEPMRKEWFGGGYDAPGIHSICFDPSNPHKIAIGISCGGVWLSEDQGQSWSVATKGMHADYMPPDQTENPAIQDPHRLVQCKAEPDTFWVQHHNGIFLSKDHCQTWTEIKAQPSSFGFAVAVHPLQGNCAWFVPAQKDEYRYPVDYKFVINKTEDYGKSFSTINNGLPVQESFDLVYRHALDVCANGTTLAAASTTGNLWVSEDAGESWLQVAGHLAPVYAVSFV